MFYSNNPTGAVFTNAPSGAQKKQIFVDYWNNGGAWAGQHSATDFENNNKWTWFNDNIDGGWFVDHDNPLTPGTVITQTDQVNHPIMKGLPSPWSTSDEWYIMNRNIEAVPGFRILAKVTVTNSSKGTTPRPAVWVTENENAKGGRAFYTIKGHSQSNYSGSAVPGPHAARDSLVGSPLARRKLGSASESGRPPDFPRLALLQSRPFRPRVPSRCMQVPETPFHLQRGDH